MASPRIPISKSADKYTWPLVAPVIYRDGIELRQVSDRIFMIIGLNEVQTRHKDYLKKQLRRTAPVDTGALQRNYDVFPLEYNRGEWALIITNRMVYFKFPFHFYLDQGHNYIKAAVDPVVKRMGRKPLNLKIPKALLDLRKKKSLKE